MATTSSAQVKKTSFKLEDQAATAALYPTSENPERHGSSGSDREWYLDSDSKLSSAGAAAPLKYASAKDLPSYPSSGLRNGGSAAGAAASLGWANQKSFEHWKPDPSASAGAAASLGWANQKSFEHWKPDPSASASKAAMLAKDYKAPPMWQPEQSSNGAKAALIAARDGGKVEIWTPAESSWGNSAANQAMKSERKGVLSPQLDYGYTALGHQRSVMAATGAMSGSRRRADSTPTAGPETYPDEANATANAVSAATHANNPSRRSRTDFSGEAGASPFVNMPREMFTSHPPVAPEVDEKRRADILRASAVAMARQMYTLQQKQINEATKAHSKGDGHHAANSAHGRQRSASASSDEAAPMKFNNLQEAAQRLAQERLAKLQNEHDKNREYRDYYGSSSQTSSRLSIRGRNRRRASSVGTLDDDQKQSQRIRAQMSLFSNNLSQVDNKKRQLDRDALLAVAQRNVAKSMHNMDERVYADTGKASASMKDEWEAKARAAAQKNSEARMENYGRVNIGGGKFMNQSAVDLIAARNVQPVLDEINEKAAAQRAREAAIKLEQESNKRTLDTQKAREKEIKEVNRKLKEHDKEVERMRKAEEKATKAEVKRAAKEDWGRSKEPASGHKSEAVAAPISSEPTASEGIDTAEEDDITTGSAVAESPAEEESAIEDREVVVVVEPSHTTASTAVDGSTSIGTRTSTEHEVLHVMEETTPGSPKSPKGVKGWLKNRFSRRMSKGEKTEGRESGNERTFVGGAALTGASTTSLEVAQSSVRDVALAGRSAEGSEAEKEEDEEEADSRAGRSKRRPTSVSSVSAISDDSDDEFEEARDHFNDELAPPPNFTAVKSNSPVRDSKFTEVI